MVYNRKIVISDILKGRGLNPGYAGFSCLVEAVDYILENNLVFKKVYITKELYPRIAAELGTSTNSVERNIRTALEKAKIYESNSVFLKEVSLDCYIAVEELFKRG